MITPEHRAFLNAAAITDEVIDSCGIQSRTKKPTGIVFTWRDRNGVELPQIRPDDPAIDANGRPIKYVFPEGAELIMNQLRDSGEGPILIVEGTKQQYAALSYAPETFAIYGISGCWGWVEKEKVTWVPDLTWAMGRDVYLLFDADLESNFSVHRAADEFAKQLKRSGVNTIKYVQTTARGKNGLDDVLGAMPEDKRAQFLALWIQQAAGRLPKKPKAPKGNSYFGDNGSLLVRKATEAVLEQSPAALTAERQVALYMAGAYRLDPSAFIAKIVDLLGDEYRREWKKTIEETATGLLYSRGLILPDHPTSPLLNVKNGMLDLATLTLKPHDPSYMSTTQIPIEWDPDAKATAYVKWLKSVLPDQLDDIEEVASTMLNPARTPGKAMFAFGPSRSGKSTFIRILQELAGVENRSAVTLHQLADDRFAAANVYGRILNASSDLSAKHVEDLSIFKMMTGEDAITGNRKYGNQFTFTNRALFAFSANELPTVGEASRAYMERIKPFHFGLSFAGHENPAIEEEIMRELPGILVRLVLAWQRMESRGGYSPTLPKVRTAFEIGSNRVLQWINDEMVVADTGGKTKVPPTHGMTATELHAIFNKWTELNRTSIMGKKTFISHLTSTNGVTEVRIMPSSSRGFNVIRAPKDQDQGAEGAEKKHCGGPGKNDDGDGEDGDVFSLLVNSGSETAPSAPDHVNAQVSTPDPSTGNLPPEVPPTGDESAPAHSADEMLVFDLETAAVDELFKREDFVRLGAYANGSGPTFSTSATEIAGEVASGYTVAGHNLTGFDLIALARHGGLDLTKLRDRVRDTDLEVRLVDPPPSGKDGVALRPKGYYGLDQSCQRYGFEGKTDELPRLAKLHGGFDKIPTDDADYRSYLAGDIVASTALIAALPAPDAYTLRENNVGLITAQMTANGFRVDVPEIRRTLDEQEERKTANFAELAELCGFDLGKTIGIKNPKYVAHLNPLATKQAKEAIVATLKAEGLNERAIPLTPKSGDLSTNGDQMKELRAKVEKARPGATKILRILDLIISLVAERTVYQTAETFRIGDRVHPSIRPYQASGRWSVTKPGLTVYGKRKGKHVERRIFLPEPGHSILAVDADQVDMRAIAGHSGDPGYIALFQGGRDPHTEIAIAVFGDASFREAAKPIGHGWNYGEGVNTMVKNGADRDLAIQFDQMMHETYPKLVEWQADVRRIASRGDLLDNGFGRKMRADPRFAYTQAPALVGQGCTRDIIAEGLLRLPLEVWPMLRVIVHDEIVLSVPTNCFAEISEIVVNAMTFDLAEVTDGRLASVPITAGASKPGSTWAQVYEK